MVKSFVAYIDESGDEGFGKLRQEGKTGQSRWLLLGAAIVSLENDRYVPSWRNEVMGLFRKKQSRDLHFRFLNHDQKVAACTLLATKPAGICVIASNKETLIDSPKREIFKKKQHLYNYLVRFLLERVTEACANKAALEGERAKLSVVFSRRSGTDYQSMRDYLCLMRDGKEVLKPVRSINWSVLDPGDIRVENHSIRAGLQIADVFTSATANALDPNEFGHTEPRYALALRNRYIRRGTSLLNCGLTLVPPVGKCPLNSEQLAFIEALKRK